jgi:hypothetical protein
LGDPERGDAKCWEPADFADSTDLDLERD